LGVTSVELLPIHSFVNDSLLLDKGLTNYWGYNTIGFFAADPRNMLATLFFSQGTRPGAKPFPPISLHLPSKNFLRATVDYREVVVRWKAHQPPRLPNGRG
jgi:hypothetical protein